jgi:hypothetical protein
MKTKHLIFAGLAIFIMSIAFGFTIHKPKTLLKLNISKKAIRPPGPGFLITAMAGSDYGDYHCAEVVSVFVANSTDKIITGTPIFTNSHLTTPWPDGIITNVTTGKSYFVVNGIIMGTAIPC